MNLIFIDYQIDHAHIKKKKDSSGIKKVFFTFMNDEATFAMALL